MTASSAWQNISEWWMDEVTSNPAYEEVVTPLVMDLLSPQPGERILDIGSGDGRLMVRVAEEGPWVMGVDIDRSLLALASKRGPVARMRLPTLALAGECVDAAYISLVLEHLDDHRIMLQHAARVLRSGGHLVAVVNHPLFTAPDSAPVYDADGEMLWRPGRYFDDGYTEEPAGLGVVRFHHRTMADLLNAAADAHLVLERMVEMGPSESQIARMPTLVEQQHIPRLMGARWRKSSAGA